MRTIQFFISFNGVHEVTLSNLSNDKKMYCTCDGFRNCKHCKHIAWCQSQFTKDNFPIQIDKSAPSKAIKRAKESDESFREFLIKYGKIEVV